MERAAAEILNYLIVFRRASSKEGLQEGHGRLARGLQGVRAAGPIPAIQPQFGSFRVARAS